MPPQTMHFVGELQSDQGIAPYAERNDKLSQKCGSLRHLGDFWLKTASIPSIMRLS